MINIGMLLMILCFLSLEKKTNNDEKNTRQKEKTIKDAHV